MKRKKVKAFMDNNAILGLILDIGSEMIMSGAETHRVEDSLYRLCTAYGFTSRNVWVVPSNIQATVTAPDGAVLTQIRHVPGVGADFDKLDRLNDLCRRCCRELPDEKEFARELENASEPHPCVRWVCYPAAVFAAVGFGIFFNCDVGDALVAAAASLLIAALGRLLRKRESNPLVLNFLIAFAAEMLILSAVHIGVGRHTGHITVGVVMLLISALGTTNGVRDLVHLDTLSGFMNITASITGALGIALGIALPLLILPSWGTNDPIGINPSAAITMAAATVGCVGFALYFNVLTIKQILSCALGAAITWGVYLLVGMITENSFFPTFVGAAVCAVYALVCARFNKAPATIFQTICIFPLIPGSALYYTAYGVVAGDMPLALDMGRSLILTCFAIVLGFMAVEAFKRFARRDRRGARRS